MVRKKINRYVLDCTALRGKKVQAGKVLPIVKGKWGLTWDLDEENTRPRSLVRALRKQGRELYAKQYGRFPSREVLAKPIGFNEDLLPKSCFVREDV